MVTRDLNLQPSLGTYLEEKEMQQIFQYISSSLANVISDPSIGPTEDKDGKEGGGEGEGGEEKE